MQTIHRLHRCTFGLCLLAAWVAAGPAIADTVTMKDGRHFEGTILRNDEDAVKIDAVVAGIRVTLTLQKPQVEQVRFAALPKGFYDPPPAPARVSNPLTHPADSTLYLEVPIRGVFGKDVLARGVSAALAYAKAHRIGHVVFVVDSTGGDLDEAIAIHRSLEQYDRWVAYHAVLHNCQDDALVFPVWSDTVNVMPGAKIGGTARPLAAISDKVKADEEGVMRAQLANEAAAVAHRRDRPGYVIRAMIDPSERLTAWKDDKGEVQTAPIPPADLKPDDVIFKVDAGELLMLDSKQAVALGLPPFAGNVEQLGKELGISGWRSESDFGRRSMTLVAQQHARRQSAQHAAFEARVAKNVSRRQTTDRYIQHNLKQASQWAPDKASYATYKTYANRWSWGWGRGYVRSYYDDGVSVDTNRLTSASRRKWRDRSDACTYYLQAALKGCHTMKRLDAEAKKLGLTPTYKDGELDQMIDDITVKAEYVNAHRIKSSR